MADDVENIEDDDDDDDDDDDAPGGKAQHPTRVSDKGTSLSSTNAFKRYGSELKAVLTDPTTFFNTIQDQVGYRHSAIFLAITVAISAIGLGLFGKGLVNVPKIWFSVVIGNYLAGLFFFGLFKVLGGKATLEKTIRANNYAIAPAIVSFIPVVGWFSGLYSFYLMYLGFKITHQVSALKAFLITFIPVASFSIALGVLSIIGRFIKH